MKFTFFLLLILFPTIVNWANVNILPKEIESQYSNPNGFLTDSIWPNNLLLEKSSLETQISNAKKSKDTIKMAKLCNSLLKLLLQNDLFKEANKASDRFTALSPTFPMQEQIKFLSSAGYIKRKNAFYIRSHDLYSEALDAANDINNSYLLIDVYCGLSELYMVTGNPQKGVQVANTALQVYNRNEPKSDSILSRIFLAKTRSFYKWEKADSAQYYLNLSKKKLDSKMSSNSYLAVLHLESLILIKKELYKDALKLLDHVNEEHNILTPISGYKYAQAFMKCNLELENYTKAVDYGQIGLKSALLQENYSSASRYCQDISEVYETQGNNQKAVYFLKQQRQYRNRYYHKDKASAMANVETKLKLKFHEIEKNYLKDKIQKNESIIKKDKLIKKKNASINRFLFIVIFSSITLFTLVIIVLSLNNKAKKRLIALKTTNEKALLDKLAYMKDHLIQESEANIEYRKSMESSDVLRTETKEALLSGESWINFISTFNQTYNGLIDKLALQHPDLTKNDYRILISTWLMLTNKEIEELLAITHSGVRKAKIRVRDKLNLSESSEIRPFLERFYRKNCLNKRAEKTLTSIHCF